MRIRAEERRAFTLIELVISSAVASFVLVGAYLCLSAGIESQKLIEPRSETAQNARVAMSILRADLRGATVLSKDFEFLGMNRMIDQVEADNLDFATLNYSPQRPGEGDYCQVSYFLERDESGRFNLWRRRNPTIAVDPLAGGVREEIANDLRGLRFEYFDGFHWYDDWGQLASAEGKAKEEVGPNSSGMPAAVRITLMFDPNPGKPVATDRSPEPPLVFTTIVRLELAKNSAFDEPGSTAAGGTE